MIKLLKCLSLKKQFFCLYQIVSRMRLMSGAALVHARAVRSLGVTPYTALHHREAGEGRREGVL